MSIIILNAEETFAPFTSIAIKQWLKKHKEHFAIYSLSQFKQFCFLSMFYDCSYLEIVKRIDSDSERFRIESDRTSIDDRN